MKATLAAMDAGTAPRYTQSEETGHESAPLLREDSEMQLAPKEIRDFRESRGWSQTEFGKRIAAALGKPERPIHWITVSRWERNVVPAPDYLPLVLRVLAAEHAPTK